MKNEDFEFLKNMSKLACGHLFLALCITILLRSLLSILNSFIHSRNHIRKSRIDKSNFLRQSFWSDTGDPAIDDFFIPSFIGLAELIVFPFIFEYGTTTMLGGWLVFKAIGSWSMQNHRTHVNRFVLANILVLISSYFLWKGFVHQ